MDLNLLFQKIKKEILVDEMLSFDSTECQTLGIEALDNVHVTGKIYNHLDDEIACDLKVTGTMQLKDAISNEIVSYPFSFDLVENVEDFIEKTQNTLAFKQLLWENIVLEVPIRYTTVNDYDAYQGEGWRLTSEEDVRKGNHPFQDLFNEEKE